MSGFDTFCDERKIRGNFREALFHYIMFKSEDPDKLTEENLATHWGELLTGTLKKTGQKEYER